MPANTDSNPENEQKLESGHGFLKPILITTGVLVVLGFATYCVFAPAEKVGWTGFKEDTEITHSVKNAGKVKEITETTKYVSGKTLWDWMGLLIAPASLALFGVFLQSSQQQARDRKEKLEREAQERKEAQDDKRVRCLAASDQREEALQSYIKDMTDFVFSHDLRRLAEKDGRSAIDENIYGKPPHTELDESEQGRLDMGLDVIRLRTLAILRRLKYSDVNDEIRRGLVIKFLADLGVLGQKVELFGADLENALLTGESLRNMSFGGNYDRLTGRWTGANLSHAILTNVDLEYTNLLGVNLSHAQLRGSNLAGAFLGESNLMGADLTGAFLGGVNFEDANLEGVVVHRALYDGKTKLPKCQKIQRLFEEQACKIVPGANLRGKNLEGARLICIDLSNTDLSGAILKGANLDRTILKGAKGLTVAQVQAASRWQDAKYDPGFRKLLGLPPEPLPESQKQEVNAV
jgi:uncharacterized protein YjbI with pentapeptide repeats